MPGISKTARIAAYCAVILGIALVLGTQGPFSAAQAQTTHSAADYVGTWHLMFQGKPFATMVIEQKGDQFTGSVTRAHMEIDNDGRLTSAEPGDGTSPIVRASLKDGALRIVTKSGDDEMEVAMTLTSATTGELRFVGEGAPPNAETIKIEKA